ncbi:MAG: cobyrinate a,c-diamide synthase [Magnetococcales bacterium]|nr:cobyrinate a,c-diamide synthase [Magnetococcales bacterium]
MELTPGFIIAATHSHAGKTTLTLAVMAALREAGRRVVPFKAGPDFIDPMWHAAFCGLPSWNLDTCMVGEEECRALVATRAPQGSVVVVEGVMGLYDGKGGIGATGSTADLARVLGLPVILVVDARGMAGSIAPLVAGFAGFARGFTLAGVLANRVGSPRHAEMLAGALQEAGLPPLLGWLGNTPSIGLGERHLGLLLPEDQAPPAASDLCRALTLDRDGLLFLARPVIPTPACGSSPRLLTGRTIAVARDLAHCFLYPANLAWLEEMGARIVFFSPLAGDPLPACDAAWLPGGYPELHAAQLSASPTWRDVRRAVAQDLPILAECGGMMALGSSLTLLDGVSWPMADILPIHTRMTPRLAGLGYRRDRSGVRGHEFHHSVRDPSPLPPAFQPESGDAGVRMHNLRASYIHWYFPSQPATCAAWFGAS